MKGIYEKRANRAGAGNVKKGNIEVANLGRIFSRGIGQKEAYNKIENELTVYEIKRALYKIGCKLYDELDTLEEMLEVGKNLSFSELTEIFNMLDSKEKIVARFEEFEAYVKENINDIKTEKDIKRLKRLYKLG